MAITDLDEQLLVRAHQAGDEHAFGQIVRSQHRALYAHAYRRLGNHEAAEDAVQDTLLRAYRALPSFDGDLRLRAWLHRILTNVCHDESTRRRRATGLIDRLGAQPVELAADPVEEAVLHDTVRIMSDALAELPESYREALVLRYVDGLSFREVAEITGVTEENARARVHRGRLALHKVLARVTVMLAFIIPGLRRSTKALDTTTEAVSGGASDHTVSLSTQLASHMYQAAPMLNRVAAEGSTMVMAKSSMVATAVAAVAAVAAPVAAYRVYDTAKTPAHPAPAVAAPAEDHPSRTGASSSVVSSATATGTTGTTDGNGSTTTTPESTTSTLPPSAVRPFAGAPTKADETPTPTSTTAPPTTTVPTDQGTTVRGTIGGDSFTVTGQRPDFQVSGPAVLRGTGNPTSGVLAGRVYVADAVGGEAVTELTFTAKDGTPYRVRFRGTLDAQDARTDTTTYTMTGSYSIPGGAALGVAESGTTTVVFRNVTNAPSSLTFDLQGQQAQTK